MMSIVTFDNSIALGTMIHLVVLLSLITWLSIQLMVWLKRIEVKQDKLMEILTDETMKQERQKKGKKGDRS